MQAAWFVGLLPVTLALLFWRSFLPDYVHFSNDGPLGMQEVAWTRLPAGFFGMWSDMNVLGGDCGTSTPSVSTLLHWFLGPVGYSKFYAPVALLILGVGAWSFFRSLKLLQLAAALGALAAMLNTGFFAGACWGIAAAEIAI